MADIRVTIAGGETAYGPEFLAALEGRLSEGFSGGRVLLLPVDLTQRQQAVELRAGHTGAVGLNIPPFFDWWASAPYPRCGRVWIDVELRPRWWHLGYWLWRHRRGA